MRCPINQPMAKSKRLSPVLISSSQTLSENCIASTPIRNYRSRDQILSLVKISLSHPAAFYRNDTASLSPGKGVMGKKRRTRRHLLGLGIGGQVTGCSKFTERWSWILLICSRRMSKIRGQVLQVDKFTVSNTEICYFSFFIERGGKSFTCRLPVWAPTINFCPFRFFVSSSSRIAPCFWGQVLKIS